MKRKYFIKELSTNKLLELSKSIKPIVHGQYLRNLNSRELFMTSFTDLDDPEDFAKDVDYSKLSVLEDRKMLHTWNFPSSFKPTVSEVLSQIPEELLSKVIAFEILEGALGMKGAFIEEFKEGYHVSIVRLYGEKTAVNKAASLLIEYPSNNCDVPVGITEEQFHMLFG